MFETTLIESTGILRTHSRKPAMISVATQTLVVAAIVLMPLLHPEVITHRLDVLHAINMPTLPVPIPPAPVHIRVTPTLQPTNTISAPTTPSLPVIHPAGPATEVPPTSPLSFSTEPSFGPAIPIGPATTGGPHITVGTPSGTPGTGTSTGSGTNSAKPTHISTGVSAGLLIDPIRPVYPAIAKAAHVSGLVMVEATISTIGRVESAHATSGPIMLQAAALDAIRAARYRPFLLNGQPTEVNATFSINFNLNQ